MKTARYFGKCKACKATTVIDAKLGNAYPMPVGGVQLDNGAHAMSANFMLFPFTLIAQDGYALCACGRPIRTWVALKARVSTKHVCGAKCVNSKGPTCDCSCGGKNHGNGYVAA